MKKIKHISLLTMFFLFAFVATSTAQRVYSIQKMNEAKAKVSVTTNKAQADLIVYKCTKAEALGNRGLWFFSSSKADSDKLIYIVDQPLNTKNGIDFVIFYTTNKSEAGWKNESKKKLFD